MQFRVGAISRLPYNFVIKAYLRKWFVYCLCLFVILAMPDIYPWSYMNTYSISNVILPKSTYKRLFKGEKGKT